MPLQLPDIMLLEIISWQLSDVLVVVEPMALTIMATLAVTKAAVMTARIKSPLLFGFFCQC